MWQSVAWSDASDCWAGWGVSPHATFETLDLCIVASLAQSFRKLPWSLERVDIPQCNSVATVSRLPQPVNCGFPQVACLSEVDCLNTATSIHYSSGLMGMPLVGIV